MALIGNLVVHLAARTALFDKGMKKSRGRLRTFKKAVRATERMVGNLTRRLKYVGLAAAGGFVLAVREAARFEKQMARVSTMLDETTMRHLPALTKGVRRMARTYGQSTEVLSAGLFDILSAQVPVEKAMETLEAAAKGAVGGFTEVNIATSAGLDLMKAYGDEIKSMADAQNLLFAINKRGRVTYEEIAEHFGQILATAKAAGAKVEDVAAAFSAMTRAGVKAPAAATALNAALGAFYKKASPEAIKVAKKYGFEMTTASIKTLGFVEILKKLKNASVAEIATIIPMRRGIKGVAAAISDVSGLTRDYETMLNRTGLAQGAFAKGANTMAFKFNRLKESLKSMMVDIVEPLMPSLTAAAQKAADWFSQNQHKVKEWAEKTAQFLKVFIKGVGVVLAKILSIVGYKDLAAQITTLIEGNKEKSKVGKGDVAAEKAGSLQRIYAAQMDRVKALVKQRGTLAAEAKRREKLAIVGGFISPPAIYQAVRARQARRAAAGMGPRIKQARAEAKRLLGLAQAATQAARMSSKPTPAAVPVATQGGPGPAQALPAKVLADMPRLIKEQSDILREIRTNTARPAYGVLSD